MTRYYNQRQHEAMKVDIAQIEKDFESLQAWSQERIQHYISNGYSQASLAKRIGVNAKTVLFGLELSQNMSHRKWIELAKGLQKLDKEKK